MPLGAKRFTEDEVLDGHAGKGSQGFDLTMLLRIDFDSESVHSTKLTTFTILSTKQNRSTRPRNKALERRRSSPSLPLKLNT